MSERVRSISVTRRAALARLGLLLAGPGLLLGLGGCPRLPGDVPQVAPGQYGDSPAELVRLWREVLAASQRDEREVVRALLGSMVMTKDELASLLGAARAERMWPRYQALTKQLLGPGVAELCGFVYERRYDDVVAVRVDEQPATERREEDAVVLRALQGPVPVYTVRIKRKQESKGLHYDFFVYRNGRWRTGYLLGKYLPVVLDQMPGQAPGPAPEPMQAPARPPGQAGAPAP